MQKNPPVDFRKVSKPKSLRGILEMLMSTCVYNGKFNSFVPPQPPVSSGQLLAQTLVSCCSVNTARAILASRPGFMETSFSSCLQLHFLLLSSPRVSVLQFCHLPDTDLVDF